MSYTMLLVLLFTTSSLALNQETLEFSINYFKERKIQLICLVTCEDLAWDVTFTNAAANHWMYVSKFIKNDSLQDNTKSCIRQQFSKTGILMNAQCEDTERILYASSINLWLDSAHNWLIFDEGEELLTNNKTQIIDSVNYKDLAKPTKSLHILNNLNISVDTDIVLALKQGNQFNLYDVFSFGRIQGGILKIKNAGSWTPKTDGAVISELSKNKYYKRWDFEQLPFRTISVATLHSNSSDLSLLTEIRLVPGVSTITRTASTILIVIAEVHNLKLVQTITNLWHETYDSNATRNAVSALYFREQDITPVIRFEMTDIGRFDLVHPSVTTLETRYYYRIPTNGPGKYENQFLRPLSPGTWYTVLGVSTLCAIALVMAELAEMRTPSVQYAMFSVIAIFCQQFFEDEGISSRASAAGKITVFVTGVSCVLIYNYYTSSVVSWLLNGPPPSINSLEELLESPLELIYQDVGYCRSWLNNSDYFYNKRNAKVENSLRQKAWSKKRTTEVIQPLEEGIAMMKAGGFSFHLDTYTANTLISENFDQADICELGSLGSMEKTVLYPGVQKYSPYRKFLNLGLARLKERGTMSCIQRRITPLPVSCEGSSPRALALGGAAPALILLAFGMLFGTTIMIIEILVFKLKLRLMVRKVAYMNRFNQL